MSWQSGEAYTSDCYNAYVQRVIIAVQMDPAIPTTDFEGNGGSFGMWVPFLRQAVAITTLSGAASASC
jgi:hypothetical protein